MLKISEMPLNGLAREKLNDFCEAALGVSLKTVLENDPEGSEQFRKMCEAALKFAHAHDMLLENLKEFRGRADDTPYT
jgi:hypothetical protein